MSYTLYCCSLTLPSILNGRYEWEPKIWDPMAASASIKPTFSSPEGTLPPWLKWEDGVRLVGVPEVPQPPFQVTAIAKVSVWRFLAIPT